MHRHVAAAVAVIAIVSGLLGVAAYVAASERPSKPQPPAQRKATWTALENRLTLREPFNDAKGKVRVVAFLSPTCPRCLNNVGEIQKFLMTNDSDELALFLVWVESLSTDNEETVAEAIGLIPDPRVQHFWDPKRVLNAQLLDAVMFDINMRVYDVYLLYDRDATWGKRLPRPGFYLHETRGMSGAWWSLKRFVSEVEKGLAGEPFSSLW